VNESAAMLARSTPSGRLLNRLRRMGLDIPTEAYVRLAHTGPWRWWVEHEGVCLHIGSQYTVSEVVAADRLTTSAGYRGLCSLTSIDIERTRP
jgi:hypothetical protein